MNDFISRQAAISRAVEIELFGRKVKVVAVSELEALPSAQPDVPDINVGDTIYRSEAIDAVAEGLKHVFVEYRDVAEKLINKLPSTQPEIVLCKDCKHRPTRDEDGWLDFPTNRCPCQNEDDFYYSWMPKDDWFCGNAERREG